ncbi:MAG: hypothetical protein KDA66_06890 [Planctomycetaceae bacterium]|nr:hypothetical protein [Planctomycetaceae bacterium]
MDKNSMVSFAEALQAVAAIGTATSSLIQMLDSGRQSDGALREKLADMQLQVATLKTHMAELVDENLELRLEMRQSKSLPHLDRQGELYFDREGDGPFCSHCYEKGTCTRCISFSDDIRKYGNADFKCPACKTVYCLPRDDFHEGK